MRWLYFTIHLVIYWLIHLVWCSVFFSCDFKRPIYDGKISCGLPLTFGILLSSSLHPHANKIVVMYCSYACNYIVCFFSWKSWGLFFFFRFLENTCEMCFLIWPICKTFLKIMKSHLPLQSSIMYSLLPLIIHLKCFVFLMRIVMESESMISTELMIPICYAC